MSAFHPTEPFPADIANGKYGQLPTKSPIVCLGSDSRHRGLKTFGNVACPLPINSLRFP